MNWLKRKLRNWVNTDSTEAMNSLSWNTTKVSQSDGLNGDPIKINIHNASGGTIVETRKYDSAKDRNTSYLYIVTPDEDMGAALSRIVTMEILRNS